MKYRPEIDGLRALAVAPVILFHAGFAHFSGGYVGVDVFFVISGYLITTLIFDEMEEGRFSLFDFYERRARRILPALFFVIAVCIPFAWVWMLPDPLENFGQSVVASVFFSNNILLWLTTGYWDLSSEFKPLLHTWSLGIEEQYYIVYPLILILIWKLSRTLQVAVIAFIALASFAAAQWLSDERPGFAFFMIMTRAWELAIGVLAAFYLKQKELPAQRATGNVLALIGVFSIFSTVILYDELTPFPGLYAVFPTLGAVLIIVFGDKDSLVGRFLASRVLVGIGLISYSAYLWHQPVLAFSKIYAVTPFSGSSNIVFVMFAFLLAFISWKFVEKPFRSKSAISRKSFLVIVSTFVVLLGGFGLVAHKTHGFPDRIFDENVAGAYAMNIAYNNRVFSYYKDSFETELTKVLVIGSSFGRDLVNMIIEVFNISDAEMIYRSDFNDCMFLEAASINHKLWHADVILFASSYNIYGGCMVELIKKTSEQNKRLYFVGTKHFGYNLNWIARKDAKQRALLTNPVLKGVFLHEKMNKQHIPAENYISILEGISEGGQIYVTDERGRLISFDRKHVTKQGAIFVGDRVLKNSPLREIFTPRLQ